MHHEARWHGCRHHAYHDVDPHGACIPPAHCRGRKAGFPCPRGRGKGTKSAEECRGKVRSQNHMVKCSLSRRLCCAISCALLFHLTRRPPPWRSHATNGYLAQIQKSHPMIPRNVEKKEKKVRCTCTGPLTVRAGAPGEGYWPVRSCWQHQAEIPQSWGSHQLLASPRWQSITPQLLQSLKATAAEAKVPKRSPTKATPAEPARPCVPVPRPRLNPMLGVHG
jgi:hypothetical protein